MDTSRPAIDRVRRGSARVAGLAAAAILAAALGRADTHAAPSGQPVPIYDLMPSPGQYGGVVRGFVVVGHTGYATLGARLVTFDLTDPRRPVPMGYSRPMPGMATSITVVGLHAYVDLWSGEHGVAVVAIGDPYRPVLRSIIFGRTNAVAAGGDRLVVVGIDELKVYDVADPGRPVQLGRLALGPLYYDVVVTPDGQRAFAASSDSMNPVVEIDLSDPRAPFLASSFALAGSRSVSSLYLAGDRLFATSIDRLHVLDIAAPGGLRELGSTPLVDGDNKRHPKAVAVDGNRAVVVGDAGDWDHRIGQLWTLDVADPSAPRVLARIDLPAKLANVSLYGVFAVVNEQDGRVRVVDVLDLEQPTDWGAFVPPGPAREIVVAGSFGYHAHWEGGLQVLDLDDPSDPQDGGIAPTERPAVPLEIAERILYVWEPRGTSDGSLALYDLVDPRLPSFLGRVDAPRPTSIAAAGATMFAVSHGLLEAYDVGDPSRPTRVGSLAVEGAVDIALGGSHAFVAAGERGLRVIDVSSPDALRSIGSIEGPEIWPRDATLDGTTVYFGGHGQRIGAIDVSDPTAPRVRWTRTDPSAFGGHAYANGRLATISERGLNLHDVSPFGAFPLSHWPMPGTATDVVLYDGHVYVALGDAGVLAIPWLDERRANPIWLPALHR